MGSSNSARTRVFISYSHKDAEYLEQLRDFLRVLTLENDTIEWWDDTRIRPGDDWFEKIKHALSITKVAVLLVSIRFLASDFIMRYELPVLLERAEKDGVTILPVVLGPCSYEDSRLGRFQAVNSPSQPLSGMNKNKREATWLKLTNRIRDELRVPLGKQWLEYTGHKRPVLSLAWSPDGNLIASGSGSELDQEDHTVQIWDAGSGEHKFTYRGHSGEVNGVAWEPEGRFVASAGGIHDNSVQVWREESGERIFIKYHQNYVHAVAWYFGRYLASASADKTVRIWSPGGYGGRLETYTGHQGEVRSVAWSPNGKYIASAGKDGTVQVWNTETGQKRFTTDFHKVLSNEDEWPNSVAWSRSGIIAAGTDQGQVLFLDASNGKVLHSALPGHQNRKRVLSLAWSPDGKRLASASEDQTAQIWDARTGAHIYTYKGHTKRVNTVAWSPDGTRIASGSHDNEVHIWQAV